MARSSAHARPHGLSARGFKFNHHGTIRVVKNRIVISCGKRSSNQVEPVRWSKRERLNQLAILLAKRERFAPVKNKTTL